MFDKTGTLTEPRPTLANAADIARRRPRARGLARAGEQASARKGGRGSVAGRGSRSSAQEFPGQGVSAICGGECVKLGSVAWCEAEAEAAPVAAAWPDASLIALRTPERAVVFAVRQALRSGRARRRRRT